MSDNSTTLWTPQQASQPALLVDTATTTNTSTSSPATDAKAKTTASSTSVVVVHPLVLLSILDHHSRRQEAEGRVIGTLLGRRDGTKVEVTNCFAVPHAERGDEVAIGKDFNKQMLSLHLRGNRKEVVVGWYASCFGSTSSSADKDKNTADTAVIADTSSLIHEFYSGEVDEGDPIHVTVDTRLLNAEVRVRAYTSTPVVVQGEPLANLFHEVMLRMESSEHETICLDQMANKGQSSSTATTAAATTTTDSASTRRNPTAALQVSMERLLELLEKASSYVDSVVNGTTPPDSVVGWQIADTLATVPRIQPQVFDKIFQDSLQDLLMVTYLSDITKTQLTIAEKLNASLGVV